ncbi:MAG TPA: hypothetical protein VKB48_09040 [Candidatus Acidoferrum sp.]|nr:hypothetical protein [Candidatus Acidoferrum sp.]
MTKAIWIAIAELVIACAAVFGLWSASTSGAFAQNVHSPATPTQRQQAPAQSELLLRIVRASTERFQDISLPKMKDTSFNSDALTGPDAGAMGLHSIKSVFVQAPPLTPTGEIDPTRPQIAILRAPAGWRSALDRRALSHSCCRLG